MDIGLLLIATTQTGDLAHLARRVESLGFESLWIPEHPVIPRDFSTAFPFAPTLPEHYGRWVDPFIALTVAATATTRLKLATGICLLPERDALLTAKVVASLDYYSQGRVLLGVGAGWLREETEVMGTPFRQRWLRLRETVEAMRVLWTQAEPTYTGEQVRFPAVRCEPKPIQPAGPPILLGAHGPKAFTRVAQTYDGWCPLSDDPHTYKQGVDSIRRLAREAGRNPDRLEMTALVDPKEGTLSTDELKAYREAGATRLVLFSQHMAAEMADGHAATWIERIAPVVARARQLA